MSGNQTQILHAKYMYMYVDIVQQQTSKTAAVDFNGRLNSTASKLHLPFFLEIKLTPI